MTVKELIIKLQSVDENATVEVWDPYFDSETTEVIPCRMKDGTILISNGESGEPF